MCSCLETPPNSLAAAFGLTVVDGCRMPEDQRVTSYSSPTGKLRKRAATNRKSGDSERRTTHS